MGVAMGVAVLFPRGIFEVYFLHFHPTYSLIIAQIMSVEVAEKVLCSNITTVIRLFSFI